MMGGAARQPTERHPALAKGGVGCGRPKMILTVLTWGALLVACGSSDTPGEATVTRPDSVTALVGGIDLGAQSTEAREYLDRALEIMERLALRGSTVIWFQVRLRAHLQTAGATTTSDTYDAIRWALRELGDNHSSFRAPPPSSAGSSEIALPVVNGRRIETNVGYVKIPSFQGSEPAAFAEQIDHVIAATDGPKICGWIVDLRGNTGGNMWPMIGGLRSLLGPGPLGSFRSRTGRLTHWSNPMVPQQWHRLRTDPPVAVITDGRTASSGEAVTVAFRGRDDTRSFGAPTWGISTGNRTIRLSDGATMLLTVSVFVDRDGNPYGSRIQPDEVVAPQDAEKAAVRWLQSLPACA